MWIVQLALRRPYTFVVMAALILFMGVQVMRTTPTDIFPAIDIPVISVVWTYGGLPAQQMEQQITQYSEYSISGNVGDIKSIESESLDGVSVIRVYLQPGADVSAAMASITAASQTIVRRMPPGTIPPIILRYSASSVPIIQLSFTSDTLSEAQVFDHVNQRVRTALSVIRGTRFPLPAGGKFRQIVVDLNLDALRAHGLSPHDVNLAVSAQNLTLPTGTAKLGSREYRVSLNSSPEAIAALNDIPLRIPDGRTILLRDVAYVHDGFAVQTNLARQDGKRSVVLSVLKNGDASTTEVAERVRQMMPVIRASAPQGMTVDVLADQSHFVTNAITGLLTEGVIAACLTAAMILLFLGSLRSTLIVAVSIPLSVLSAFLVMRQFGATINTMTLGGLALAVGILVDDATVEIENIHRNLAMGKPLTQAILDGAQQIAVPAFVASLSIGIVFVSVFFLEGPARYLFMPMGLSVALSVMASYLLSRTLVPTMVQYLLRNETHDPKALLSRVHQRFERGFERFREAYLRVLARALAHRQRVLFGFAAAVCAAIVVGVFLGTDFFPSVDAGQLRLHVSAAPGTRLEEAERVFSQVEDVIRQIIPDDEREGILDLIGMAGGYNLAMTDSQNMSASDGEVMIALKPSHRVSTQDYQRKLRAVLPERFPEASFYFQAPDIVTQILNFGLPAPIDIQVSGVRRDLTLEIARGLTQDLRAVRGAVDVRLHQVLNAPRLHMAVDRLRASDVGLSQRDIANNVLLAISSSGQVNPSFWTDPVSGNSYPVSVQVPDYRIDSLEALTTLGINTPKGMQLFGDLTLIERKNTPVFATHVNIQPTFNVRADIEGMDLGSIAKPIDALVAKWAKQLPPGATLNLRGQIESMRSAFGALAFGLAFAALLVYALMVVNFQSWLDPFIIITALPGAMVGIVLCLFVTQTTLSVPSLMGAIMSIGVATANSILVVTFANEQLHEGRTPIEAALEAGRVRLRPVLMTALAMLIGMLPMSLGISEGGEQNAALGRAVIGGLCGATVATLFFVPVIFSLLKKDVHA